MIQIDYDRDKLLSEQGFKLVTDYYLKPGETSPQEAFARASGFFATDDAHAQRLYDAVSKQYFMFSSPILSNSGPGTKGMPISCFLSHVPDTVEGLVDHLAEFCNLSVLGGGVGGHWDAVRSVSDKSPGPMPFIHTVDSAVTAYKQGKTRKGAYAAYLNVSHPSIVEFINMRVPTGGDINRKNFNSHNAVNIPDAFMSAVDGDGLWDLKDPHSGKVVETVRARHIWETMLETRHRTGEPFLNWIDTINDKLHPAQKQLGLKVRGSNLCNEIHLPTDEERTAVCCLASLNLEMYDEWPTTLVADLIEMLDNVIEYFINNAPDTIAKARYAAMRSRDLGLGAMGWHGYLMKNSIPFDSHGAIELTGIIFSSIKKQADAASQALADIKGACPDSIAVGGNERNLHKLAIAPNANSSSICNATASIEAISSNAYPHRTRAGTHLIINKHLTPMLLKYAPTYLLDMLGESVDSWLAKQIAAIVKADGSVQGLAYLSAHDKDVFKTFKEVSMFSVVEQAGERQQYLCQGQSLNVWFAANADKGYLNRVHRLAHKLGVKGMYYLRTGSVQKIDKISAEVVRATLDAQDVQNDECTACHA
jgi:ribonucleoside-diphosphate reductase alpha chain